MGGSVFLAFALAASAQAVAAALSASTTPSPPRQPAPSPRRLLAEDQGRSWNSLEYEMQDKTAAAAVEATREVAERAHQRAQAEKSQREGSPYVHASNVVVDRWDFEGGLEVRSRRPALNYRCCSSERCRVSRSSHAACAHPPSLAAQGWGNTTAEQMRQQMHASSGQIHGSAYGDDAFLESPPLAVDAVGRHYLAVRLATIGPLSHSRFVLQTPGHLFSLFT